MTVPVLLCLLLLVFQNSVKAEIEESRSDFAEKRSKGAPWDFSGGENGPENWYKNYPDCAKHSQSPIKIERLRTQPRSFGGIKFGGYDTVRSGMRMVNNGHTVQLSLAPNDKDIPYIEGGGLGGRYYFRQLHFHWGTSDSEGSEHVVNENVGRALEVHLVHTNPDEKRGDQSGIAVLGVTFQAGSGDNAHYKPITNALDDVIYKGTRTTLKQGFALRSLLPSRSAGSRFYRYKGSLTTPPCTEGVIWTLFEDVAPIGNDQMKRFRSVYSTLRRETPPKSMAPNFRPVQPLNNRIVYLDRPMWF